MSIYFQKGRGWKYDFTLQGERFTSKYFKTKKIAKEEEAKKREQLLNPPRAEATPTVAARLRTCHNRIYLPCGDSWGRGSSGATG